MASEIFTLTLNSCDQLTEKHTINFYEKLKARFKKEGWFISTALAPKTSAEQKGRWYEAHDYKAHGEIVDFVVIMTYEWGIVAVLQWPFHPSIPFVKYLNTLSRKCPPIKF